MDSPISSNTAEIFLKILAQQIMKQALDSKIISYYVRHVDKIFILYNRIRITQRETLDKFKK
jgi:hypothetical protein